MIAFYFMLTITDFSINDIFLIEIGIFIAEQFERFINFNDFWNKTVRH